MIFSSDFAAKHSVLWEKKLSEGHDEPSVKKSKDQTASTGGHNTEAAYMNIQQQPFFLQQQQSQRQQQKHHTINSPSLLSSHLQSFSTWLCDT